MDSGRDRAAFFLLILLGELSKFKISVSEKIFPLILNFNRVIVWSKNLTQADELVSDFSAKILSMFSDF